MLVMDETFRHVDRGQDRRSTTRCDFPDWWERDVEAMVRKDLNHPSVDPLLDRQRDPRGRRRPHGRASGRALAEKVRALDDTRFVTNGDQRRCSPSLTELAEAARRRGRDGGRHQHDDRRPWATCMDELMRAPSWSPSATAESLRRARRRRHATTWTPATSSTASCFPHRVIVGSETFPRQHRPSCGGSCASNPHVIGDFTWTGWDYLGEAGIGRVDHRRRTRLPAGFAAPYPWLAAPVRRHRHHRPPAARVLLPGDRLRAAHRPLHRRAAARAARRASCPRRPWSWTRHRSQLELGRRRGRSRSPSRSTATPTRSSCCWTAARSAARAGGAEKNRSRAAFEVTYAPGELVAVARTGGEETGATRAAVGRPARAAGRRGRPRRDPGRRHGPRLHPIALEDAAGNRRRATATGGHGDRRGPGVLAGLRQRRPAHRGVLPRPTCTRPSTAARWPSSAPPGRATSRSGSRPRSASRSP